MADQSSSTVPTVEDHGWPREDDVPSDRYRDGARDRGPDRPRLPVEVPTTVSAILGFESGVQATLTLSVDAWQHSHPALEIYGTLGTLTVPDPNFFGGEPPFCLGLGPWESIDLADRPWSKPNFELPFGTFANYRGAGVEDLVEAIVQDRPHRATGELAAHVVDVLERILESVARAG